MTNQELASTIRCNLFAKRDNLKEAFDYFYDIVSRLEPKDQPAVTTGMAVILNTIAETLEPSK